MPIPFQPRAGAVVRCDFHGMIAPEMVKMRDVVVIARHKRNSKLVTVVPLSANQPNHPEPYLYELPKDPRPDGDSMRPIWAKGDMVYTVSL
ncbi:MAG: type II toxin-antitoxin system PemK/MazF family toxin [Candidatus Accumulibacter sp.]|nr:type II toxin-antitoxin system PemK/MazF family toxin [Accumulibacter sp.]